MCRVKSAIISLISLFTLCSQAKEIITSSTIRYSSRMPLSEEKAPPCLRASCTSVDLQFQLKSLNRKGSGMIRKIIDFRRKPQIRFCLCTAKPLFKLIAMEFPRTLTVDIKDFINTSSERSGSRVELRPRTGIKSRWRYQRSGNSHESANQQAQTQSVILVCSNSVGWR